MKRFSFLQEALLRLKKQRKRIIESTVLKASQLVVSRERDVETLLAQLQQTFERMRHAQASYSQQAAKWNAFKNTQQLQQQIDQAQQLLTAAKTRLSVERQNLKQAEIEVEALQTLRAARLRAHRARLSVELQHDADEATMFKWMGQQSREADR